MRYKYKFSPVLGDPILKEDRQPEAAVAKYNWLHAIAQKQKTFIAPPAKLIINQGQALIAVQRVHRFTPLRHFYIRFLTSRKADEIVLDLLLQAGRALAAIHTSDIPYDWCHEATDPDLQVELLRYGLSWEVCSRKVPLHGDFELNNVGATGSGGPIVVLDPCANSHTIAKHHQVYGDPYLDIGKMLACLEGQVDPLTFLSARQSSVCQAQAAFIRGYSEVGFKVNLEVAFAYSAATYRIRNKNLGLYRRMTSHILYNFVRGNASVKEKLVRFHKYAKI